MNFSQPADAVQATLEFWQRLTPMFVGQAGSNAGTPQTLLWPGEVTKLLGDAMAAMTVPLSHNAPFFAGSSAAGIGTVQATMQSMIDQWKAMMTNASSTLSPWPGFASGLSSPQALGGLLDFSELFAGTPGGLTTAFDRTYGALSDALGLGPARQLQVAWHETIAAGVRQQEARANYARLVQAAMTKGMERLMARLADKAGSDERIDSLLALIRLWAVCTEEAMHETLQADEGLAATAALTRAGLSYRKHLQHLATIVADTLDLATRRDVDEAHREIQALKRELRALRATSRSGVECAKDVSTTRGTSPNPAPSPRKSTARRAARKATT